MLELAWLPVSLARRALPPKRGCGHAELESTRVAMALLASVLTCHKHEPAACDAFNRLTGYIARREARLLAWRTCDRLTVDGRWRGGTEPNADSGYILWIGIRAIHMIGFRCVPGRLKGGDA